MNKIILAFKILLNYINGYKFFLEKLGLIDSEYQVYKTFFGFKYKTRVKTSDFAILNEIIVFKEYEDSVYKGLNNNSLVLDFGAQAGSFSCYTAYNKKCKVIGFEPEIENYKLYQANISLNGLQDLVIPYNKAIAKETGQVTFYPSSFPNKGVHSMNYIRDEAIKIDAIDLFELVRMTDIKKVDFLKIDIEGTEHDIVDTKFKDFFDIVQHMVIEYHCQEHVSNKQTREELINKIKNLGFKPVIKGRDDLGLVHCYR